MRFTHVVLALALLCLYLSFFCVQALDIRMQQQQLQAIKKEVLKDKSLTKKLINYSMMKIEKSAGYELCPMCVDLLDFALADLMAAVDAGAVFSCMSLCNYVNSLGPYAVEACNVICTAVGKYY